MTQLVLQLDNLSSDASEVPVEETLTQILTQQGILFQVLHVKGNSAYVDFENIEYAQRAFTALDGLDFMGSRINVSYNRQENGSKYKEGNRDRNYKGRKVRRTYHNEPAQQSPPIEQYPCRVLIPTRMIKVVLGKDGSTIQEIEQATNTKIDVHREKNVKGSEFTVTTIKGSSRGFSTACEKIVSVIDKELKTTNDTEPAQLKILGHDSLCGRIIGKDGRNLKSIKQRTGARVIISNTMFEEYRPSPFGQEPLFSNERVITIEGTVDVIAAAEEEISRKLRKSLDQDMKKLMQNSMYPSAGVFNFLQGAPPPLMQRGGYGMPNAMGMTPFTHYGGPGMSMNGLPGILGAYPQGYSQFNSYVPYHSQHIVEHCTVIIPTQAVGAVIGKKGLFINRVKEFSQAQQVRVIKGEEGGESRVEIIGIPEAQWKVQLCVFSKLQEAMRPGMSRGNGKSTYGCDGKLRTEYMVPGSSLGRIIGKKGQVVIDIQDRCDTDIEVPKDKQGGPQAPVYITGTFNGTQMALNRIRDIVARSQHQESMK